MGVGAKIKEARMNAGLSQQKLADASGVKRATIAAWESGRNQPDPVAIRAIAIACGVSADFLLSMPADLTNIPDHLKDLAEKMASLSTEDRAVFEKVLNAMVINENGQKKVIPTSHDG